MRMRVSAGGPETLSLTDQLGPRELPFSLLQKATRNFSPDAILGVGGFGKVYRGVVGGDQVAMKRVDEASAQGEREFLSEITTIGRLRHKNIVPLLGWCETKSPDRCLLLVYDYMPNGSLEHHLFGACSSSGSDHVTRRVLSWGERYHVLQGVAAALVYMHEEWEGRVVVHRDVKAANVLLDGELNARLGDFGLVRLLQPKARSYTVTGAAGTVGYLAPEALITGKVSAQSDVFSFGVLALEVACGRRAILPTSFEDDRVLVTWVWELHRAGRLLDAADPDLRARLLATGDAADDRAQILLVLRLGLLCCVGKPSDRPSMRLVSRATSRRRPPRS